jgi:molybdopterin/thiamine biosynthesis adenylyltransferase
MDAHGLREFLKGSAVDGLLPWTAQLEAGRRFGASPAEVEESALVSGLLPRRYQRNRTTLSVEDQLRLFHSRVAVIGCGGLGGYLIEELARIGVGTLVLVDPDVFEEHNLNRQLYSTPVLLGAPKAEAARARVAEVNPAVTVQAHRAAFSASTGRELLTGCSAVADGLDSAVVRHELAVLCAEMSIPLVHGAIAGWYGQVTTQLPGSGISPLLRQVAGAGRGIEAELGNPSFTPAAIASLQIAEVVKVLLGRGKPLAPRALFLDLLNMEFNQLTYR